MWPCSTCVNVLHVLQAGARTSADEFVEVVFAQHVTQLIHRF